jgi:hypothetical protein
MEDSDHHEKETMVHWESKNKSLCHGVLGYMAHDQNPADHDHLVVSLPKA